MLKCLKYSGLILLVQVVLTACQPVDALKFLGKVGEKSSSYEQLSELEDANLFLKRATVKGSVVAFTIEGCEIDKFIQFGNIVVSSSIGSETIEALENRMKVRYLDNCDFFFAKIDTKINQVTYSSATVEDIRSQSNLTLYGEIDDNGVLNAQAVFITSYDRE